MVKIKHESGQAAIEYVLLLAIVVMLWLFVYQYLAGQNFVGILSKPLTTDFKYTYQYGDKDARGQDDGGPKYIPQYIQPSSGGGDEQNFRIFINPPINQ
jgi:hypothetical protein